MTTLTDEGWLNRPVGVPVPSARLWAEIRVPIPDFAVRPLMAGTVSSRTTQAAVIRRDCQVDQWQLSANFANG